jgi:hypothetical protein
MSQNNFVDGLPMPTHFLCLKKKGKTIEKLIIVARIITPPNEMANIIRI